jgi:hypothetical protein
VLIDARSVLVFSVVLFFVLLVGVLLFLVLLCSPLFWLLFFSVVLFWLLRSFWLRALSLCSFRGTLTARDRI